jgi:hypothetical protein
LGHFSFVCKFSLVDGSNEEAANKFEEEVEDTAVVERQSKRELKMINDSAATRQLGSGTTGGGGACGG